MRVEFYGCVVGKLLFRIQTGMHCVDKDATEKTDASCRFVVVVVVVVVVVIVV